jgi:hypothetical protein
LAICPSRRPCNLRERTKLDGLLQADHKYLKIYIYFIYSYLAAVFTAAKRFQPIACVRKGKNTHMLPPIIFDPFAITVIGF